MTVARLRAASLVGLVLFLPTAAAWIAFDGAWWTWLLVGPPAAVTFYAWLQALLFVHEDWVPEADRRVWRGWLLVAGALATPSVLRALERRSEET